MKLTACLLGLAFVAVVVACTNSQTAPPLSQGYVSSPQAMQAAYKKRRHHDSSGPITKIFVIVQENRTVDNLFQNFPGAHTQPYGYNGSKKITLTPVDLATPLDLGHSLGDYNRDTGCPGAPILSGGTIIFSCPMNGFQAPSGSYGINAYQYVKATDTKPYFDMGEQYVFGDTMFQSNLDGSYVSHQYLVAGQANSATDFPVPAPCNGSMATPKAQWVTAEREYGKDPKYITACQTYKTVITQELENASLKWRYYVGASGSGLAFWDPFFWIISGYGYYNNHKNIVSPPCQFLSDIGTSSYAPDVTWITPSNQDSDHAGNGFTVNRYGPDWVTAVVNAIGKSNYWKHSVIFITWDDWGGWYDHVMTPYEDYDGLGVRVPLIIISPYALQGVVTHVKYEQASILRYIEDHYKLQTMASSDSRANDPANDNIWNLGGTPRPFVTISPYPNGYNCNAQGPPDAE